MNIDHKSIIPEARRGEKFSLGCDMPKASTYRNPRKTTLQGTSANVIGK